MKAATILILLLAAGLSASAGDLGQWESVDPAVAEWFRSVMQPDNPGISC